MVSWILADFDKTACPKRGSGFRGQGFSLSGICKFQDLSLVLCFYSGLLVSSMAKHHRDVASGEVLYGGFPNLGVPFWGSP